jgi:hypothetical protein
LFEGKKPLDVVYYHWTFYGDIIDASGIYKVKHIVLDLRDIIKIHFENDKYVITHSNSYLQVFYNNMDSLYLISSIERNAEIEFSIKNGIGLAKGLNLSFASLGVSPIIITLKSDSVSVWKKEIFESPILIHQNKLLHGEILIQGDKSFKELFQEVDEEDLSDYPVTALNSSDDIPSDNTLSDNTPSDDGLSTGAIIGIVIGVVAFIAIIVVIVIFVIKRKKDKITDKEID